MAPSAPNEWFQVRRFINDSKATAQIRRPAHSSARSTYLIHIQRALSLQGFWRDSPLGGRGREGGGEGGRRKKNLIGGFFKDAPFICVAPGADWRCLIGWLGEVEGRGDVKRFQWISVTGNCCAGSISDEADWPVRTRTSMTQRIGQFLRRNSNRSERQPLIHKTPQPTTSVSLLLRTGFLLLGDATGILVWILWNVLVFLMVGEASRWDSEESARPINMLLCRLVVVIPGVSVLFFNFSDSWGSLFSGGIHHSFWLVVDFFFFLFLLIIAEVAESWQALPKGFQAIDDLRWSGICSHDDSRTLPPRSPLSPRLQLQQLLNKIQKLYTQYKTKYFRSYESWHVYFKYNCFQSAWLSLLFNFHQVLCWNMYR